MRNRSLSLLALFSLVVVLLPAPALASPQGLPHANTVFEVEQPPTAATWADLQAQPAASAPPAAVLRALAILAMLWGVGVGYCLRQGYASQFWSSKSQDDGSNRSISPDAGKVNLDGVGSIRRWA